MFAIAIVDTKEDVLLLARDFAGIKPCYFGISEFGAVVASQFNQIYKHPWHKDRLKLRPEMVKEFIAFGYMQAPNTIYDGIFQVEPGSMLCIKRDATITKHTICKFSKEFKAKESKHKKLLQEVLSNTIKRQLVSDVSIATFLSGGIDSPLISAYAKKEKDDIEAFTVKVNDDKLNESEIAKTYASHLHMKQHIHTLEASDFLNHIESHFQAFSEPFGDFSSIPTYLISKASKKRHTVMLSGDGGDELFFGYPRMLDILNKSIWFKFPLFLRTTLVRITNTLRITRTWAPFFKTFSEFVMFKHIHISKGVLENLFPDIEFSIEMKKLYAIKNSSKSAILHQLRWNEFYGHMQRVLVKVDRASMMNSLEVRVPFLDKQMINAAWETKQNVLKTKPDLKHILKELLAKEIPQELLNKKKMGFAIPIDKWLHTNLKKDVLYHTHELPIYGAEILQVDELRRYITNFYNNSHNDYWGIWHIYAWQKWAYTHLDASALRQQ
jgi:asparagine synthase (glutamine-hydrolysing)